MRNIWNVGQSEVITIVILTGVILSIAIVTLYFGGDLLNRTGGVGEFVSAQSSFISFASLISQRASVEGAAGSVVVPTRLGDLAVTSTSVKIYFKGLTLVYPIISSYNGSYLNVTIYYANRYASGTLVTGTILKPGEEEVIYGDPGLNSTRYPITVRVSYDNVSSRWTVSLNTMKVLYSQLLENKTIVYLVLLKYSENYNARIDTTDSTLLRFYVEDVERQVLPTGETIEIYFDNQLAGRWGGAGQQVTLIISKILVETAPVGGG